MLLGAFADNPFAALGTPDSLMGGMFLILNSCFFVVGVTYFSYGIVKGVVAGIGGYGNSIGIPTIGGEVMFDDSYAGNPLVNVFCLGIAPRWRTWRRGWSTMRNRITPRPPTALPRCRCARRGRSPLRATCTGRSASK